MKLLILLVTLFLLVVASDGATKPHSRLRRYVYAVKRDTAGNQLISYFRNRWGYLEYVSSTSTGGVEASSLSPVDPLGSQNSLILSPDHNYLLTVNSGSNTISVLKRNNGSLSLSSTVSSGPSTNSSFPSSLAVSGAVVYVLNAGLQASIRGYTADWTTGVLTPIPGSIRSFDGAYGQISLDLSRMKLIVSGKGTNNIFRVFSLNSGYAPTDSAGVVSTVSPGPFSFIWDSSHNYLLATAASGGAASYTIDSSGTLSQVHSIITSSVASCWIAGGPNSNNFYVGNAGQPSISGFMMGSSGLFSRIDGKLYISATNNSQEVALFGAGSVPLDLSISSDNKYLHVLLGGRGNLATFAIQSDGTLLSRGEVAINGPGYNSGLNGIVAA